MNIPDRIYVHTVEFLEPEMVGYGRWMTSTPKAHLLIEVDAEQIRGADFSDLFLVDGRSLMKLIDNYRQAHEEPIDPES